MAIAKSIDIAVRAHTTEFEAGMRGSASTLKEFSATTDRVMASMDKAWHLFNKGAIEIDEYNKKIAAGEKDLEALKLGFNGMAGATERASATLRGLETETDRYQARLRELDALLKLDKLTLDQHAAAVRHVTSEYKASIPTAELVGSKTSWLSSLFNPLTTSLITAATAMKGFQIASNAVRSAIEGVGDQFEEIDSAKKAAATIGIATGELMKLRFAVQEVAGVSVDDPLKKMIKNIAEAAITGKGATDTINRIGLSVSALSAMSPEKAFFALTDAISRLEGTGERAAAIVKIFGKEGMSIGPIFEGGAEQLRKSAEFADKFGLSLSEIDASAIEQANDSLHRLSAILDGVYRQIAVELAPQVLALSKTLIQSAESGESGINRIGDAFFYAGHLAAQFLQSLRGIVVKLADMVLPAPLASMIDQFFKLKSAIDSSSSSLEDSRTFTQRYMDNLADTRKALEEAGKASQKTFTVGGSFDTDSEGAQRSAASAEKAKATAHSKALAEAERRAKQIRDMERDVAGNSPLVKFKHQVEDIDALLHKHLITLEKRNQLVAMAHKTIVQDPANKKEMEERKKRVEEATKFRINSNPMEKFAEEAARIRKLELSGELTQQQAARATLDARKEAIDALVKLQKAQIVSPKFSLSMPTVPNITFPQPVIPQPKIPTFHLPQYKNASPPQNDFQQWTARMQAMDGRARLASDTTEMDLRKEAMKVRGEELTKKLEHPFTTFKRTVDELQSIRNIGAIDPTTLATGLMEARKQAFEDLSKRPEFQIKEYKPAAIEAGTQAAFSAFHDNKSGADQAKQQLDLQRKMEAHLAKLARGGVVLASAKGKF